MATNSDASRARTFSLARRFAWASWLRLILLSSVLAAVLLVSVRDPSLLSYSVQLVMGTLACAFTLSAVYAWFLRAGRHLQALVAVQLVLDQLIWTVVAYLSGGISSGATSFYGVTCFMGALLSGYRGSLVAAAAALVCYVALVIALSGGWLPVPPDQPASLYTTNMRDIVTSGVANALMLAAVVVLGGTLAERLRTTGGQLLDAEARAQQAEREAALGRLAAGLAHEIRNPLGAISGSVALLGANPNLAADERELHAIIQREAERLNDLLSDMLNLANPRVPQERVLSVTQVAREVVQLGANSGRGGSDVTVEASLGEEVRIEADEAMLRQLLWNLVRNAVQASNPGDRVRVVVATHEHDVIVDIIDHGKGLSDEEKSRIFDPFYTTRSKGTGIGLAVVRRIADQHGFSVSVLDTPGGGATFRVNVGPYFVEQRQGAAQAQRGWTLFPKARS